MPNLANLLDGEVDRFAHQDIDNIVAALTDEMERIDLKRDWPANNELAHDVCSFANGRGGVIILGYDDPAAGKTPFNDVDGSPKRLDSAYNSVHAMTAPAVRFFVHSYQDGPHTSVAIVIPPTENGPHEYIGGGKKTNLPIRRGKAKDMLSLGEIVSLQRAASGMTYDAPEIGTPALSLDVQPTPYWGVEFTPEEWPLERFAFSHEDDVPFQTFWQSRFAPISFKPLSNGIEISQGSGTMHFTAVVNADGSVVVVWRANSSLWMYFRSLLENAYCYASLVFHQLNLAPRALARVRWTVNDVVQDKQSPFSEFGQLTMRVDFSRDAVEDVLLFFIEQADRLALRTQPREQLLKSIREARKGVQSTDDPRARWEA